MRCLKLHRRLTLLEQQATTEEIVLYMPDGRTETLCGNRSIDLLAGSIRGSRTPEMEGNSSDLSNVPSRSISARPDGRFLDAVNHKRVERTLARLDPQAKLLHG